MMQKYEVGACRISAGRLQELAALYDVPVSFFLEGDAAEPADLELLALPEALELLQFYTSISDERDRRHVLAVVQSAVRLKASTDKE